MGAEVMRECRANSSHNPPAVDITVRIAAWEIECCAPPPRVGESAEWRLYFTAAGPEHDLNFTTDWTASPFIARPSERDGVNLRCGQITAFWGDPPGPIDGPQRLTGQIHGTWHGGAVPDLYPVSTALVRRVRVIRHLVRQEGRVIRPVIGSLKLTDVQMSPKRFNRGRGRGRGTAVGEPPWSEDGVLIDLAVTNDESSPGSSPGEPHA